MDKRMRRARVNALSTLLNQLTGSDIPANNRLFDTLDTTTRRLMVDELQEVLLSDTVGFIRKLPHHLVEAFKATLEELQFADVLLHVIDTSKCLRCGVCMERCKFGAITKG